MEKWKIEAITIGRTTGILWEYHGYYIHNECMGGREGVEKKNHKAHIQVAISENNKAFHVCGNAFIVPIL